MNSYIQILILFFLFGGCEQKISGCTDQESCNYNAEATEDDNSCQFPEQNFDCEGNCTNCILFTKEDFADEALSENQDCIVENICLTRGLTEPLYNAVYYSGYSDMITSYSLGDSVLIRWAEGTVSEAELGNLNFVNSLQEIGGLTNITSKDIVGYIVNLNIYLNFNFLQWTIGVNSGGTGGGGFSYIRDVVIPVE